jgi:hypothetical protein
MVDAQIWIWIRLFTNVWILERILPDENFYSMTSVARKPEI